MSQIQIKQINLTDLANFIIATSSGTAFSGNLAGYFGASGYFGNYLAYVSGGSQNVSTQFIFSTSPDVPYLPNDTGSAINQTYFNNGLNSGLAILYVQITGNTISISGNDILQGYKGATGRFYVNQFPQAGTDVVNLNFLVGVSGILAASAGNTNSVNLTSNQLITGIKSFVSIPGSSGTPINPTDLVTKAYVDNAAGNPQNTVTTSGFNQNLSGTYNFTNTVAVPIATISTQPVQLAQLQALGTVMGGITGFAGVVSINGTSGASGLIYLQGAGNVAVIQCGPIFYISGLQGNNNTQLYSAKIPIPSGITGMQVSFSSGFQVSPVVVGNLEVTGGTIVGYVLDTLYGVNPNGFNIAFQNNLVGTLTSGIPGNNYLFDFYAIPNSSGSGFFGIQGQNGGMGPSFNSRGIWQVSQSYAVYDIAYNPPYNATYMCYVGNISTTFNQPGGTGNSNWVIVTSGAQGSSGIWNSYINYSGTGQIFYYGNTTTFNGSSYGYTGLTPTSGIAPTGAGWALLAAQGNIGYYINSGGIITGNFVNMSFFLNPVNTGLNLAEAFIVKTFNITGFAVGCITSGTGIAIGGYPGPFSGDFYTRDTGNNKTIITGFTFNSGQYYSGYFNMSFPVTGYNRIGIDITNTLGGLSNMSIGIFGFGYL